MTVEQIANSTLRKLRLRFVPLFFTCFVVAWLDRVNVGFAALTMSKEIGLSSAAFGFGAGVFFLSHVALEIPAMPCLNDLVPAIGSQRLCSRWVSLPQR